MWGLPRNSEAATVACHTRLSNHSQDLLEGYLAKLPFEKKIFDYSQNLWITLWMLSRDRAGMWRGARRFVSLPIFYKLYIVNKNK